MDKKAAVSAFEALSSGIRLDVFRLLVRAGERVRAGSLVALSGNTGEWTSGPHLHYEVWQDGEREVVAPVKPTAVVDPTGCGDAWRGGLLYGLEKGWPLVRCAELGNRLGALKIAQRGPQYYQLDFTPD